MIIHAMLPHMLLLFRRCFCCCRAMPLSDAFEMPPRFERHACRRRFDDYLMIAAITMLIIASLMLAD